jgi:hypothetical protein
MVAFLRGKGQILWDVMVNTAYVHPLNFLSPGSRDMFDANNKAVNYLYHSLCEFEFERVQIEDLACRIWEQLKNAHARNAQVQARLFVTYRREYENFTHLLGESIDSMFCFRRKHEERLARELANKDRYHPSRGVPEHRLVPRGEGTVRTIYSRERHEFVPRGEPPHREGGRRVGFGHGEFAGRSFACGQYEYGGTIAVLGPRGATGHGLPFVVRVVLQGDVWVFHLGVIRWILLTPRLRKWQGTPLIPFVLTIVLSHLLTLALVFDFAGGKHGELLVDRLRLLSTHDR